jgi:5-methylcytosine-specific restriction endonuclease McrA
MADAKHHGRKGRPWRRLREQVLREEPTCYLCGKPATTVDHVLPLSLFPTLAHERANLRGCCRFHNLSKGDRMPRRPSVSTRACEYQW